MNKTLALVLGAGFVMAVVGAIMLDARNQHSAPAAQPAQPPELSDMSDDERNAFRDEVRAYLLDQPEVLMEAFGVLETRQAEQQAALDKDLVRVNAEALFNDGYSHVAGNPDGDITLVEFVDYRCGYCRKAHDVVQMLLEQDPGIRLIIKEYPILNAESMLAARYAVSAQLLFGQDAYGKLHEALITQRGTVTLESLIALGDGLGLDGQAIAKGMTSDGVERILGENRSLGQRMQISGTPAFVMHDDLARGYMPIEQMEAIIAAKRAEN